MPRRLGQHFLSDASILAAIADAAGVGPQDTVIEVGPGRGPLTRVLAERARRVVAVELDEVLAAALRAEAPANVAVVTGDARTADPATLLGGCTPYTMVGNLPYYAAMPILRRFLECPCPPVRAVVLVQREVAVEMCAAPGRMSLLSVAVQLYGRPRVVRLVRPGSFSPPPRVMSAVVVVEVYRAPAAGVTDVEAFFRVARAGFSAPRKQLRNSLAHGLAIPPAQAEALLARARIGPDRRAQTLRVDEWAALAAVA